tara:strand:- start:2688 stop:3368 length:681 start_codon:yes stop_codon:yes gene_type:complete
MTKNITELVTQEMPAFMVTNADMPVLGNENLDSDSIETPEIKIVQAMSKCRQKNEADYIKGAEEGQLYNTVTRELYEESIDICFANYKTMFALYKTIDAKTTVFKGLYGSLEEAKFEIGILVAEGDLETSLTIKRSPHHFGVMVQGDALQNVVIVMAGSNERTSKSLNSRISLSGKSRFAKVYTVSTVSKSNSSGNFYSLKIEPKGWASETVYKQAEEVYNFTKEA